MRGASIRVAPAVLALALLGSAAFGQGRETAAVEGMAPSRVFFEAGTVVPAAASRFPAVLEFLKLEIEASTRLVVVYLREDADAIATVGVSGAAGAWTLSLSAARRLDGSAGPSLTGNATELTLAKTEAFIRKAARALDAAYPPVPISVTEVVTERVVENKEVRTREQGTILTIRAPEGTRLLLEKKDIVLIDASGVWSLALPQNTAFSYRAELAGRMPVERTLAIGSDDLSDEPVLEPLTAWEAGADIRYANLVLVPAGAWYPVPGRWYVGGAIESSALAMVGSYYEDDKPSLFYLDLQAGAGYWFGTPDQRLRLALEGLLATRLDVGAGLLRFADYATVSAMAAAKLSWRVWDNLSVFIGASSRLAWVNAPSGVDPANLLAAMPLGLGLADGLFRLEWPTFYAGARYGL